MGTTTSKLLSNAVAITQDLRRTDVDLAKNGEQRHHAEDQLAVYDTLGGFSLDQTTLSKCHFIIYLK